MNKLIPLGKHWFSLSDEHELEDVLGRDVRDTGAEVVHRVTQAGNDGLSAGDEVEDALGSNAEAGR